MAWPARTGTSNPIPWQSQLLNKSACPDVASVLDNQSAGVGKWGLALPVRD
jgi:hypothetical protein